VPALRFLKKVNSWTKDKDKPLDLSTISLRCVADSVTARARSLREPGPPRANYVTVPGMWPTDFGEKVLTLVRHSVPRQIGS